MTIPEIATRRFTALRPDAILKGRPEGSAIYRIFIKQGSLIHQDLVAQVFRSKGLEVIRFDPPPLHCYTVVSERDTRDSLGDLSWIERITREEARRSPRAEEMRL